MASGGSLYRWRVNKAGNPPPSAAQIILLDLELSRSASFHVLRWLRSENTYARIPVIALASADTAGRVNRAYELGANSCVIKNDDGGIAHDVARGIGSYARLVRS